ncbi:MAG: hypothetical protein IID54_06610 [Proteobacteria bacterium]|nr:hypothetical protein [Pseudomonadota bacterium]
MTYPTDMGPARWCGGCREWWPAASFGKGRYRCKACFAEAAGIGDRGEKGETLFLFAMGYSLEVIAERLGVKPESVAVVLRRAGIKRTGWVNMGTRGDVYFA